MSTDELIRLTIQDIQVINAEANVINREHLLKQGCGQASDAVQKIRNRSHQALTRYRNFILPKPPDEQTDKVQD